MKLRLDLKLSQKLIMTPQLQQAIKLLQLSRLELQQSLTQHILENPLLDEVQSDVEDGESSVNEGKAEEVAASAGQEQNVQDESREEQGSPEEFSASGWEEYFGRDRRGGDTEYASAQDDLPSYEQTVAKPTSLEEHLLWQLSLSTLTDREKTVGRLIIGNLDDDGYLRISLAEVIAGTDFTESEAESVLKDVQTFDPTGVAARDLPECLLLQLRHVGRNPFGSLGAPPGALKGSVIEAIVLHHLKDLERRQYAKVAKALNVTVEDVFHATKVIGELEPKPGRPFINTQNYVIVPDVFVVKNEGEWVVLLNDDGLPRMRISPYYKQLISSGQSGTPETKAYMDEKMRAAQWVIRSIEQRNRTIVKVVSSIVKFQEEFFEHGVQYLKPLVLKQVAEDIGMHESTISRVTANKYMYCPQGMLELKFFFNAGLQRADEPSGMHSSVSVRDMIKIMVAEEDAKRPLKDEEIAAKLFTQGVRIARRTVAKYRAELNIASASQRKQFF
ncbi:MAG: RNA polymerase sigma-54 factor [Nitrospira sp. UW-LDO-01]|jgi:RNA polymerase sigma-54 factor|uniref:RNA polymerase, sigma-54 (Sigma N) factor n=1 Tax=Candidatus Nitrospira nitrosa TaxID=1742972 RepID=A0A0S4LG96_9BACT|nr:RNA polymerase factor sigma-54 [Candidatus Nitrospira nitrosa]MBL8053947.1 RNA polymerase factor sigma-54 [Nitrospira sp.]OYT18923.1 MAG: RNA polymerase sigma-54 factor [Nitrospira sp. UW-LDO-01]CUS35738.1 RNA polymerase, sigma-54 (Sigma N) factor [Candidatus Nitrospira nitrosa]